MRRDIGHEILSGLEEFNQKLKRMDLIPATRFLVCPTCNGDYPEWCSGCAGSGVVSNKVFLNDWPQQAGDGAEE